MYVAVLLCQVQHPSPRTDAVALRLHSHTLLFVRILVTKHAHVHSRYPVLLRMWALCPVEIAQQDEQRYSCMGLLRQFVLVHEIQCGIHTFPGVAM